MKKAGPVLLAMIFASFATYFITKNLNADDNASMFIPTENQVRLLDTLEKRLTSDRRVSRGTGTRISERKAKDHIQNFKSIRTTLLPVLQSQNLSLSSSYSFGLDEIIKLCQDIDTVNKYRTIQKLDSLTGIRIHLGRSVKTVEGEDVYYVDAFITPVDKSGKQVFISSQIDYRDIADKERKTVAEIDSKGSLSLNVSNPCPDVCD